VTNVSEKGGGAAHVAVILLVTVVGSEGPHVEIGFYLGFIHILNLPLSYVTASVCSVNSATSSNSMLVLPSSWPV
jgi:hypothetical protein